MWKCGFIANRNFLTGADRVEIPIRLRFIFGISNDYRTLFISNICFCFFCVGPFSVSFVFFVVVVKYLWHCKSNKRWIILAQLMCQTFLYTHTMNINFINELKIKEQSRCFLIPTILSSNTNCLHFVVEFKWRKIRFCTDKTNLAW